MQLPILFALLIKLSEFSPDIVIWMNTISKGRFENTNKIFEKPKKVDFEITDKNGELNAILVAEKISHQILIQMLTLEMARRFKNYLKKLLLKLDK